MISLILGAAVEPTGATTGPTTQTAAQTKAPFLVQLFQSPFLIPIIVIVLFYVLMIRSKRKQDRSRQDMLGTLKRGDRVQTIGGMLGTVLEAREDEVLVKVDETSNTKIRFVRSAIHRVVEADKVEKAAK
jgi:preprotein translocase subunit YajC